MLSSKKVMGLLAYLAMRPGHPVSRSHAAGLLWPDVPEEQARNNLRQALSQLRKVFREAGHDPIDASSRDITLRSDGIRIPAAGMSDAPESYDLVELARGPGFLEGLSTRVAEFDTWISTERQAIEARLARALEARAVELREQGRLADAIETAAASLRLDPLNEAIHRALMELLAAHRRPDAALAQYEACREVLKQGLGVEPSPETSDLALSIRRARDSRGAVDVPAEPTLTRLDAHAGAPSVHGSLEAALSTGLDLSAEDRAGRWLVTLGPPDPELVSLATEPGVYLDDAHSDLFDQASAFTLERVLDAPRLRRIAPVARNRMMVSATTEAPAERIQDVLSIVVLPFRDMSQSAQEVSLGLVLAEEVSARLARFWQLTVASPSAAMTSQRLGLSPEDIHAKLGVNFAVEGNVFRLGDELKLSFSIVDLRSGGIIASERLDGRFADIFEHQSDLVDRIATCITRQTESYVEKAAQRELTNDIGAFDWYLRALANYRKSGINLSFAREAVTGFDTALTLDPEFVRSTALRACAIAWYDADYVDGGQALEDIQAALSVTDDDPEVHRIAGSLSMMSGHYETGLAHAERAVQMNPSDAYLLGQSAIYWSWYGEPQKALPIVKRAMTLDPFLPVWAIEDHGVILYSMGDYEGAIDSLTRLPLRQPRGLAFKAASQIALGDVDAARTTTEELLRHTPDYSADQLRLVTYYRDAEQTKGLFDRLGQAGLH